MNHLIIILIIGLSFFSCANGMTESQLKMSKDKELHLSHNQNMMRQINNDIIINKTSKASQAPYSIKYFLDVNEINQKTFQQIPLDTIFYIDKIMSYPDHNKGENNHLQISYTAYTENHYENFRFSPEEFNLTFDESDKLVLQIKHAFDGELYAYGFDKKTGKQGINPYYEPNFEGTLETAQSLISRNIDELRLVVTIADSIYIHDFKIEDFYSHEH